MPRKIAGCCLSLVLTTCFTVSSLLLMETVAVSHVNSQEDKQQELAIAARFAPIFYQGLGDDEYQDYIRNFDFDGDWRGDNNWTNADNRRLTVRASVYYAVSETQTHLFIHYAVFHPRDYKGGNRGTLLSGIIREGARLGGRYDPTGKLEEAALAHENDMEGCLVVVAKNGNDLQQASVVYVETMAHNRFWKYVVEGSTPNGFDTVRLLEQRPRLYIEPKGHGIEAYRGSEKQSPRKGILIYDLNGQANNPTENRQTSIRYDLVPLYTTLWPRARRGVNETYGEAHDYGRVTIRVVQKDGRQLESQIKLGVIGSAFRGRVGANNMARPPWGWFDQDERDQPLGGWFFDPARSIQRHFKRGSEFSTSYISAPFLGVQRMMPETTTGKK
jgi:hypothetical protein